MPEYLAPGVYVEEVEIGGKPIEGVSTSTVGFLGETERGSTRPTMVTGLEEYRRLFGGYSWEVAQNNPHASSNLPYAVEGFFANGGKRCFIGRILGKDCHIASFDVPPETSAGGGTEPTTTGTTPESTTTGGTAGPTGTSRTRRSSPSNPGSNAFTIKALGPGVWGNRIGIKIERASLSSDEPDKKRNPELFKLVVVYWKEQPPPPVVDPRDRAQLKDPNRREPVMQEDYDNLSPIPSSSDYFVKRINGLSSLIAVEVTEVIPRSPRPKNSEAFELLRDGKDGNGIGIDDYKGKTDLTDPNAPRATGLEGFSAVDEISIVCAPDEENIASLSDALVEHCENLKDRFAILQAKQADVGKVDNLRPPVDSKYAAFYFPWIKIIDPVTGTQKPIPPGGHVAGIYARSDIERGVHKAPANEVVRGAVDLQISLPKGKQDLLNPRGVNCIRAFPGRGIRVWGARTVSSDPAWKYLNVRRLFLFVEESIDEGTQWVVFEPNDQRLWSRVRQSVSDFLTRVWRDGALLGRTPEEAFFVKCDETTMTPDDLDVGRLIVVVGIAPVKPAEFVIFRIAQWRGGSEISE